MKILLIIVICFCCFLIGLLIRRYYLNKQRFYKCFYDCCNNIYLDISYGEDKLCNILNNYLETTSESIITNFLKTYISYLRYNIDLQNFKNKSFNHLNFLDNNECNDIINFCTSLGNGSKDEELRKVNEFKDYIKRKESASSENNKKYSSLYFKLFIILGFMIGIIFL